MRLFFLQYTQLMRFGDICYLTRTPVDVEFPVDIAVGLKYISHGDNTIVPEDEEIEHSILEIKGDADDAASLHPEVKAACEGLQKVSVEEKTITAAEAVTLNNEDLFFYENSGTLEGCKTQVYNYAYSLFQSNCTTQPQPSPNPNPSPA